MADIVEVIHRINYEVNDDGLQRATSLISGQLNELLKLQGQLVKLQREFSNTSEFQTAELERISRSLNRTNQLIEKELGKTKGLFSKYGLSVIQGLGIDEKFGNSVAKWLQPATKGFGGLETAGSAAASGIALVAKNISPVSRIVTTLIPILFDLAENFYDAGSSAEGFGSSLDDVADSRAKFGQYAAQEIGQLLSLKSKIEDVNASYSNRVKAVNAAKEQFPGMFDQLSQEAIMVGKVGDAYERIVKNIMLKAQLKVLTGVFDRNIEKLLSVKGRIEQQAQKEGVPLVTKSSGLAGLDIYDTTKLDEHGKIKAEILSENAIESDGTYSRKAINAPKEKTAPVASAVLNGLVGDQNIVLAVISNLLKSMTELQRQIIPESSPSSYDTPLPGRQSKIDEVKPSSVSTIKPFPVEKIENLSVKTVDVSEVKFKESRSPSKAESFLFGDTADMENNAERHKEELKKTGDAYKSLADTAVQAFQTINDAQIKALDKEIEIRQKRVEAAMKLAERGNTEALRIEQERLDETIKKREQFARRQQIVNAAMAVSNSVLAVAQAAGQTGAGALVIVPAVIAAIVAGYAAISAATQESTAQAFADGVVGFNGKGGPRDDANWVRISSGESVITAAGTKANRHILEAINNGTQFKMLDMPMLNVPAAIQTGSGYASKENMKGLEKKLDGVIAAIEDNRLRQNIYFNEQGVGLMTQRAVKRDQNRYR